MLTGTRPKSAKDGKIQLKEAYGDISAGEAWLMNAHIGQYSHGNIMITGPFAAASCCSIAKRSINCSR